MSQPDPVPAQTPEQQVYRLKVPGILGYVVITERTKQALEAVQKLAALAAGAVIPQ